MITEGSAKNLKQIRDTSYRSGLLKRPLRIDSGDSDDPKTWGYFRRVWDHFNGEEWRTKRGRVKHLLEETAASKYRGLECKRLFQSQDCAFPPGIHDPDDWFDAMELFDFFYPWEGAKKETADAATTR